MGRDITMTEIESCIYSVTDCAKPKLDFDFVKPKLDHAVCN